MKQITTLAYFLFCIATAMIGNHIGNGLFFTILNFFFAPIFCAKWLICHDVNVSIIKDTFSFFLQ